MGKQLLRYLEQQIKIDLDWFSTTVLFDKREAVRVYEELRKRVVEDSQDLQSFKKRLIDQEMKDWLSRHPNADMRSQEMALEATEKFFEGSEEQLEMLLESMRQRLGQS